MKIHFSFPIQLCSFFLFFFLSNPFSFSPCGALSHHRRALSLTSPPPLATSLALATTTSLVHLGTKNIDFQMERYVFKRRSDGWFFCLFFTFSLLGFCYCFGLVLIISNSRVNWCQILQYPCNILTLIHYWKLWFLWVLAEYGRNKNILLIMFGCIALVLLYIA